MSERHFGWLRRRRYERKRLGSECEVRVPNWTGESADCLDVSPGGIRMRLPDAVTVGDTLIFSIQQPDGPTLEIIAEVRHVNETAEGQYEVGMRWSSDSEAGRRAYQAVVGDDHEPELAA